MTRAVPAAILILGAGLLSACGGGGGGSDSTTPPPTNNPPPTPTGGLDSRPSNTTCVATAQPNLGTAVGVEAVFANLTFSNPVLLSQAPADTSKWYVVEQGGTVRSFANTNGVTTSSVFADITDRVSRNGSEAGLLGMAFDPDFASNGRVYLSYTADPVGGGVLQSRISRFTAPGGVFNAGSEEVLLTIAQPFTNHNGGNIAFGPDGKLYAGFGDGGSGGDPNNNAQDRGTLLGKMIRIDVSGTGAYTIPTDNPFTGGARCQAGVASGGALCPEIYAYGFRNPWRWSFDNNDLWVADVGQNAYEEVDRVERGGNYGWRFREGLHCYNPTSNCPTTADGVTLIPPVAEYGHDLGASITGGYVYRGSAIPSLVGRYVFGDFVTGRLFVLIPDSGGRLQRQELLDTSLQVSSFGQGPDGELYVVDYSGKLYKLVATTTTATNPIKQRLSQTGCVDASSPTQPASGLIPYTPSAPFWSDGATKQRWMAVPDGQKITVDATTGDFDFPNGTVLVKSFTLNGQLIETRLFMRHTDTGNWGGYTYRWDDAHTDATLVSGGLVTPDWIYPSEAQCLQCHTNAAGGSLGLESRQLNTTIAYPTGRSANQLDTLEAIGMFTASPVRQPALPNPADTSLPVADRARAYLHTNCSQCHRPNSGVLNLDLRYTTAIADSGTCNASPASGDLGVTNAKVIAPGDSTHSVLYLRMNRRDANQMPPIATQKVDTDGAALIQQWINAMNSTCS